MEQLAAFLTPRDAKHAHYKPQKNMYLSTTDNQPQSYILPISKVKTCLRAYATLLEETAGRLHINVLLTGMIQHMLCLDVDYSTSGQMHHHKQLYKAVVREIQTHMVGIHVDKADVYDAYYMTREGNDNYHLVFPFVYMNRLDYDHLVATLKREFPELDAGVKGWMLYGSCKRLGQSAYRVIGKLQCREGDEMSRDPDLSLALKAVYKKPLTYIYTFLFYPGDPQAHKVPAYFHYPLIVYSSMVEANYLASFVGDTMVPYYMYLKPKNEIVENAMYIENLYHWLKSHQDRFTFRGAHPVILTYLKKFYPPLIDLEADDGSLLDDEPSFDALTDPQKRLYRTVDELYTLSQFIKVIRDYESHYATALLDIYEPPEKKAMYTEQSILYELAYRHGQQFHLPSLYICKKQLQQLKRKFMSGEVETYYDYIGKTIVKTIPITVVGKEAWLFDWATRQWKPTTVSIFANLFLNTMADFIITQMTDDIEMKDTLRKTRGKFTDYGRMDSMLGYQSTQNECLFDQNPNLLGLAPPFILDLQTCHSRLAIPQDLVSKHAQVSYCYPDRSLFDFFLREDTYLVAFEQLKSHLNDQQPITTFRFTGTPAMDDLFTFLCLMFCHDYQEMLFFIQFLAQSLVGKNPKRWFLFLLGHTSNGKTTVLRLLMYVLKNYCGILNQSNFFASPRSMAGNESASPQLTAILHHRLVVIEELASYIPLNPSVLNSFSGNNRIFSRALYKEGKEVDIYFKMVFTLNTFPHLTITNAIRQRIKILRFNSSFLPTCTEYDFDSRQFPQNSDLDVYQYAEAFLSLLVHALSDIRDQQGVIHIPHSVHQNLAEMAKTM